MRDCVVVRLNLVEDRVDLFIIEGLEELGGTEEGGKGEEDSD